MFDVVEKRGNYPGAIESVAYFDSSGKYRYLLWRRFRSGGLALHFCMLNPATADENKDDPTIKRCINRALGIGYNAIYITNLFGIRSGSPSVLVINDDPVGPANDAHILTAVELANRTIVAWGAFGVCRDRGSRVLNLISGKLYCLGKTQQGYPRHPLYVAYKEPIMEYDRTWHP